MPIKNRHDNFSNLSGSLSLNQIWLFSSFLYFITFPIHFINQIWIYSNLHGRNNSILTLLKNQNGNGQQLISLICNSFNVWRRFCPVKEKAREWLMFWVLGKWDLVKERWKKKAGCFSLVNSEFSILQLTRLTWDTVM